MRMAYINPSHRNDDSQKSYGRKAIRQHLLLRQPAKLAHAVNTSDAWGAPSHQTKSEQHEAWELDCNDASRLVESHESIDMPLFVLHAQPFHWQHGAMPI